MYKRSIKSVYKLFYIFISHSAFKNRKSEIIETPKYKTELPFSHLFFYRSASSCNFAFNNFQHDVPFKRKRTAKSINLFAGRKSRAAPLVMSVRVRVSLTNKRLRSGKSRIAHGTNSPRGDVLRLHL